MRRYLLGLLMLMAGPALAQQPGPSPIGCIPFVPCAELNVSMGASGMIVTPGWFSGAGTWLNLDTTGPSGIGSGGPGVNAWLAYVAGAGQWIADSGVGDIAIRNTSGALRFSNNGTSTGLSLISNVVTAPTFASSNATITGGTVDGTAVGSTTASTGKFTTLTNGGVAQSPYVGTPLFGTGADGSVTISSGTTTLSRDMHYANLTLSGTGTINTAGFRVFVSGTADFSAAATGAITAIGASGNAASGATAGGAANITGYGGTVPNTPLSNGAGGAGSTTTGTTSAAAASIVVGLGGIGGQGGSGGASTGAGGAAGAGGSIFNTLLLPTPAPSLTAVSGLNAFVEGALFGSGGGGGGGDATNSGGGGGGGGGAACTVQIYARFIQRGTNTNTSIISAKGGAGGAGAAAVGGNAAGGGGGGGGGGGAIYIVTESLLGSTIANALDVSGGSGASGGNGLGTGKGGAGGTGGATGRVHVITLNPASVGTTANVANGGTVSGTAYGYSAASAAGTAGSTTSTTTGGAGGAGATMKVGL